MIEHGGGTLKVGQETFAVGLFWQAAPSVAAAAREARIVAVKAEIGADLFALRRLGLPQFGLGTTRAGHKPKMAAIAAVLANAVPEMSWVGVFEADEGWLFVSVRKGAIMPDGDALFRSEEEARARLREDLSVGGWETVFAPEDWLITEARATTLAELCGRVRDGRLTRVAATPLRPFLIAGGIVAGGLAAWAVLMPAEEAPPQVAVPDVPVAPPPPPPPWEGKPRGIDVVAACEAALRSVTVLPGYMVTQADCDGRTVSVRHSRTVGAVSWLPSRGISVLSPDEAVQTRALDHPPRPRVGEDALWSASTVREMIWGAAQSFRINADIGQEARSTNVLVNARAPQERPFNTLVVTLGSPLSPTVFASVLQSVPTWVVDSVSWKPEGWQVKGKVYVR